MSASLAIIGGSGLYELDDFELTEEISSQTPYGKTSATIQRGVWQSRDIVFFPRHGKQHKIPPHKINYRANLWAIKQAGIKNVIAVNAVGGINPEMGPQTLVIPDQIIDYSWGREHTFSDGSGNNVLHVDMSQPYSTTLREVLLRAAQERDIELFATGVYGCTNGPRLETPAEIRRMAQDGCDLVGMTGMPEAGLARELDLDYAAVALVVNAAAGVGDGGEITMDEILDNLQKGLTKIKTLIGATLRQIPT